MAQHLKITEKYEGETKDETKAVRNIIKELRADLREERETDDPTKFENKYTRLPDDYCDKGETAVYIRNVGVPETMVVGGRATLEVHFRMSRISNIFLVA